MTASEDAIATSPATNPARTGTWLRVGRSWLAAVLLLSLVACGSVPGQQGYHRVTRGDTLYSIARQYNRSVDELVRWNRLSNPNRLTAGQLLRVSPPDGTDLTGSDQLVSSARTSGTTATQKAASSPTTSRSVPERSSRSKQPTTHRQSSRAAVPRIALVWPADGRVIREFNGSSSKGIAIAGNAGAPVRAAANGTVAYAGNQLRGYGNLVILKHSSNFITIYAHNRKLLVKEGQTVRQGQTIAEMGDTDTNRVQLYFELRHDGQPTNPMSMLPPR